MGKKPHVLALPFPVQSHVNSMLELMLRIASHGFKVTFVNAEFIHTGVVKAISNWDERDKDRVLNMINMVSVPAGGITWEERNDSEKVMKNIYQTMPVELIELMENINGSEEEEKITCVVADQFMGWALDVAAKMQIKRAAYFPAAASVLALAFSIPQLLRDGIIDNNGTPKNNEVIHLSPEMPISTSHFQWASIGDLNTQKAVFGLTVMNNNSMQSADWIICNSAYELEPTAFDLFPSIIPIGPHSTDKQLGNSSVSFWQEDQTCLEWLDQQQENSVIYIAFGTLATFEEAQFQELAMGIELTNKPFLWVVRPDLTDETEDFYLKGFKERVGNRGKIVAWAPQEKVLAHPSIACFFSHCGWNSVMEGLSIGTPFLCWPYFGDHFMNQRYMCDVWKVGLAFDKDENGIVTQEEIKRKVKHLLLDKTFKERAVEIKNVLGKTVKAGGRSSKNFIDFIESINSNS